MKPIEEFYLNCYGRNGACRSCVAAKNRQYYQNNKARIQAKHADRRNEGIQRDVGALARRQETPFEDRHRVRREQLNERKRERDQLDEDFKAQRRVDLQLRRALQEGGNKFEEMFGCTTEWFEEWIASQFTGEMTMANYGEHWSYDHVIPKSAFNVHDPDQVKECNHWSNWRPTTKRDNSMKHDKRDPELEAQQAMNAYIFRLLHEN